MTGVEDYRTKARAWLCAMTGEFGPAARRGMGQAEALDLGRRYQAEKFAAGYTGIDWPADMGGQGLTALHKLAFAEEEMPLRMPSGFFAISLGMPVPILMRYCQDKVWARERVIAALKGEEIWCQLFSEPAAGSDLAGLRTRAELRGEGWVVNGQKLWTSWAQYADYGVIVVRTDPTVAKHRGLSYFWINMKAPGVTVRPIKLGDTGTHVNECFFDEVRVDDAQRLGEVGGGFGVAMATLMIERYVATDPNGFGPTMGLFVELARECEVNGRPALADGRVRSAIARNYALRSGLEAINNRAVQMIQSGMEPGPEGSLNKLVSVRSRQKLSEFAIDLMGLAGLGWDHDADGAVDWVASWLSAPTGRIAGGADEMLLNTIAERILGLPQDHRPDKGIPFNTIPA